MRRDLSLFKGHHCVPADEIQTANVTQQRMTPGPDYMRDYRLLGCAPGDDRATLERAWRRAVSALHPDRGGEHLEARGERLREVTAAYRRLSAFADLHGRLPGQSPGDHGAQAQMPAMHPAPAATANPRRWWPWFVAIAGLLVLATLGQPAPAPAPEAASGRAADRPGPAADDVAREGRMLRLGDDAGTVLAAAGAPLEVIGSEFDAHWHYGPSFIHLRARRVVDWYSSPLRPLPVETERPPEGGSN